jgi:hypothetical protein
MQIKPNPVVDQVSIQTDLQIIGISIYSTTGTMLIHKQTTANTIDISSLPSGAYLLIAETSAGIWSARLIKE